MTACFCVLSAFYFINTFTFVKPGLYHFFSAKYFSIPVLVAQDLSCALISLISLFVISLPSRKKEGENGRGRREREILFTPKVKTEKGYIVKALASDDVASWFALSFAVAPKFGCALDSWAPSYVCSISLPKSGLGSLNF